MTELLTWIVQHETLIMLSCGVMCAVSMSLLLLAIAYRLFID